MRKAAGAFLSAIHLRRPVRHIYRYLLGRSKNLQWRYRNKSKIAPDGLPFPLPDLCYRVAANYNPAHYYSTGSIGASAIMSILKENGTKMESFESVLDFGCGCGRLARHRIFSKSTKLYGTDINKNLVRWSRENIPFVRFLQNDPGSALIYPDNSFDFIYAVAVFGHLREDLQHHWMKELGRVLKPGGYLLVTTKGIDRLGELNEEQAKTFLKGRPVVIEPGFSGTGYCLAYTPESYFRNVLAQLIHAEVIFFRQSGSPDTCQDVYLLRKHISIRSSIIDS